MEFFEVSNLKCSCGNDKFFFRHVKNHVGMYCSKCGKWRKWCNSNEKSIAYLFFLQFDKE